MSTNTPFQKVCVVGLGYIGLPTGTLLASNGLKVHGVDVSQRVVDTINRGEIHIVEPDLDKLVHQVVKSGHLSASLKPAEADVFILAVPTPVLPDNRADISYVEAATRAVAPYVRPGNLVILESTSPIGTTEKVGVWLREMRKDLYIPERGDNSAEASGPKAVRLAHCPERVLPGHVIRELVENDRIIGGINKVSTEMAEAFYKIFVKKGKILLTDANTAEMAKLTENSFRDVNIAFANELSLICDRLGIDVWELIGLANHHPRVNILQPGPGVGGHCIAVDPWFIVEAAPEQARLIRTSREVNNYKPLYVIEKIHEKAARLKDPVVACFGLAFKPDIDDLRESPSVEIVEHLAHKTNYKILAVEPHITELPKSLKSHANIELADVATALKKADICVMLVNHAAFKTIDRKALDEKILIDTRGVWR